MLVEEEPVLGYQSWYLFRRQDRPPSTEHQQYLGITEKKSFAIPEIKAEVVLIEIFSMY